MKIRNIPDKLKETNKNPLGYLRSGRLIKLEMILKQKLNGLQGATKPLKCEQVLNPLKFNLFQKDILLTSICFLIVHLYQLFFNLNIDEFFNLLQKVYQ